MLDGFSCAILKIVQSDGDEGPTKAITVFIDLASATVMAIDPRGFGPDGPEG